MLRTNPELREVSPTGNCSAEDNTGSTRDASGGHSSEGPKASVVDRWETLGRVDCVVHAISHLWNKFSNSFYGDAGPRWIWAARGITLGVFNKLEVRRHGVVE